MWDIWNSSRFRPEESGGFYESYFQRANHPHRPLAFWIRYTVFSPEERPNEACGELWAIFFNGETARITAVKEAVPIADCIFSRKQLEVRIGQARLSGKDFRGRAASPTHHFEWTMQYSGQEPPLLLLPESLYEGGFPKAKALVGKPNAVYTGKLRVDGDEIPIDGWRGSQNHNWGSRHTDRYAWGQVAGFDNAPEAFLECATAQVKLGPVFSPRLTMVVLREEGQEIALNGIWQAVRASAKIDFFTWSFDTRSPQANISGRIEASANAFVGLCYQNPPGGTKTCLNSKLASAEITVKQPGQPSRTLVTRHRAAFEIITDRRDHGVRMAV